MFASSPNLYACEHPCVCECAFGVCVCARARARVRVFVNLLDSILLGSKSV